MRTSNIFPDTLGFGIAFRPIPQWTMVLDAERYGWSSFDTVTTKVERKVPAAGFTDRQTVLDWRDRWMVRGGVEYRPDDGLSLRAGYMFLPTYVPSRTLDPSNPDANQHIVTIGLGCEVRSVTLDFFYGLGLYEGRRVKNTVLSGRYENLAHYFGFGLGKRF